MALKKGISNRPTRPAPLRRQPRRAAAPGNLNEAHLRRMQEEVARAAAATTARPSRRRSLAVANKATTSEAKKTSNKKRNGGKKPTLNKAKNSKVAKFTPKGKITYSRKGRYNRMRVALQCSGSETSEYSVIHVNVPNATRQVTPARTQEENDSQTPRMPESLMARPTSEQQPFSSESREATPTPMRRQDKREKQTPKTPELRKKQVRKATPYSRRAEPHVSNSDSSEPGSHDEDALNKENQTPRTPKHQTASPLGGLQPSTSGSSSLVSWLSYPHSAETIIQEAIPEARPSRWQKDKENQTPETPENQTANPVFDEDSVETHSHQDSIETIRLYRGSPEARPRRRYIDRGSRTPEIEELPPPAPAPVVELQHSASESRSPEVSMLQPGTLIVEVQPSTSESRFSDVSMPPLRTPIAGLQPSDSESRQPSLRGPVQGMRGRRTYRRRSPY